MQGRVSKLSDAFNLSLKKIPDAVLAVGQPAVAIAEENTLSVFGLALKSKHLVNVQYFNHLGQIFNHLGEMGEGGTSRCGVAELLAFGGI